MCTYRSAIRAAVGFGIGNGPNERLEIYFRVNWTFFGETQKVQYVNSANKCRFGFENITTKVQYVPFRRSFIPIQLLTEETIHIL
jgi:long-subunit fatty acid transport protein